MKKYLILSQALFSLFILYSCQQPKSVSLVPGYDKTELISLLPVIERTYDSTDLGNFKTPAPVHYTMKYRSPESPLKNRFDIWQSDDGKGLISIRGTILDPAGMSFAAAFYTLMVPASGTVKISDSNTFEYKLAEIQGAGVHLGLLLGLGCMATDILSQIDLLYQDGIRDFYILGHSQGSGLANLATSYLLYLQKDGKLPSDIRFKTYCVANMKSGNLWYAYDYENLTSGGRAFSIQNVVDWVPTVPPTVQNSTDEPPLSPYTDIHAFFIMSHYPPGPKFDAGFEQYSKLIPGTVEFLLNVVREIVSPKIHEALPQFVEPETMKSYDFVRMGITIPLIPDSSYFAKFPVNPEPFNVWENHSIYPYYCLLTSGQSGH
ncbi:MAG: hypothetical protein IH596_01760 [Bacteroidales bacterium]|nr:hypothetical protein [Bacteroidales bacterium]